MNNVQYDDQFSAIKIFSILIPSFLIFLYTANLYASTATDLANNINDSDTTAFQKNIKEYNGDFYLNSKESLLELAIASGSSVFVDQLLGAGAKINGPTKSFRKKSHLHLAVETGQPGIIRSLIAAGADLNAIDKLGQPPLIYAVLRKDMPAVEMLVGAGANFDNIPDRGESGLLSSFTTGSAELVQTLLDLGAIAPIEKMVKNRCGSCHGMFGESERPYAPHIAGQDTAYLFKQLTDFKTGKRQDINEYTNDGTVMSIRTEGIPDALLEEFAEYYSNLPKHENNITSNNGNKNKGEALFKSGLAGANVPNCITCHRLSLDQAIVPGAPDIVGMNTGYLAGQLKNFRSGFRVNDITGTMKAVTAPLSDSDIEDIATYLSGIRY